MSAITSTRAHTESQYTAILDVTNLQNLSVRVVTLFSLSLSTRLERARTE